MMMDPTTESIAHFIGLFELKMEELRLRQDYLEFRLKQSLPDETPPMEVVGVRLEAPYQLRPYDPGLDYDPQASALPPLPPIHSATWHEIEIPPVPGLPPAEFPELDHPRIAPAMAWGFVIGPPMSIVTVTLQSARLYDDDVMVNGLGAHFLAPAALHATLAGLAGAAEALEVLGPPDIPWDGAWLAFASEVLAQMEAAEVPAGGPAEAWLFRGETAQGVIIDGAAAEEAPDWQDLMPHYLRPEEELEESIPGDDADGAATDGETLAARTEDGRAASETVREHDFSRDFRGHQDDPFALEPGHEVVAGANTAINEAVLASKWLDASLFVVLGDVARLDAISQVNVLVEHDTIDGLATYQPSLAANIAEITTVSSHDPDDPASPDVLPLVWDVVRIEADLIQVNWVKQFTFASDFDRAEVTFTASATFLGFGENEIVNSTVLNEFGYLYDLVFVAGNMVDATVVTQKNVLYDSDRITTTGGGLEAAAAMPEPEPAEPEPAAVAEIGAPKAEAVTPAVEVAEAPADEAPDPAPAIEEPQIAQPEPPAVSLADNLLLNKATLETTGADSFAEMTEKFAAAAEKLAEGAETISREVAQDAMFAGREALRVLQVDGDLAKVNLFEQTNIVGDADQIHIAMETLRGELEAEMKLIAGSNALVNLATVIERGVDSKIMAAGEVYDEALIHQAGLIDTDAVPNGVAMSALVNEAMAFLADGMLEPEPIGDEIVPTGSSEGPAPVDVMQTLLA